MENSIEIKAGESMHVTLKEEAVLNVLMKEESTVYIKIEDSNTRKMQRQIWLSDLVEGYKGPPVYFDFSDKNELIGIEVLR